MNTSAPPLICLPNTLNLLEFPSPSSNISMYYIPTLFLTIPFPCAPKLQYCKIHGQDQESMHTSVKAHGIRCHPFSCNCHGNKPWKSYLLFSIFRGKVQPHACLQVSFFKVFCQSFHCFLLASLYWLLKILA